MPYAWIWLGLTILLELPFHLWGFRNRGFIAAASACVLINGFTHPLAYWAVFSAGMNWSIVELLVCLVEAFLIWATWRGTWTKSLVVSLVANGVTAGVGWVISTMI